MNRSMQQHQNARAPQNDRRQTALPNFTIGGIVRRTIRPIETGSDSISAFLTQVENEAVAVKVFNNDSHKTEKMALEFLYDSQVECIPRLRDGGVTPQGNTFFALTPACQPIISIEDCPPLSPIVDALHQAHALGIVNRGINRHSIMKYNGTAFLVDWRFTYEKNAVQDYMGDLFCASSDILYKVAAHGHLTYRPSHDLIALVHVFILLVFPPQTYETCVDTFNKINWHGRHCEDDPQFLHFCHMWKFLEEKAEEIQKAMLSAMTCDYEGLKKQFMKIRKMIGKNKKPRRRAGPM